MNVFSDDLIAFKSIGIKGCTEIQFAHGGHLFAAVQGSQIIVYNFWTGESGPTQLFKGHNGRVKCILWNDDDSGFYSTSIDGNMYVWNIQDNNQRIDEYVNSSKPIFTSVAKVPEMNTCYLTSKKVIEVDDQKYKSEIDLGMGLSQAVLSANARTLFVSTNEPGHPGTIIILKANPLEKIMEVQAHSAPITRMKLSFCTTFLFTVGEDGHIMIYEVKDKDPKGKKDKDGIGMEYSDEILTLDS